MFSTYLMVGRRLFDVVKTNTVTNAMTDAVTNTVTLTFIHRK